MGKIFGYENIRRTLRSQPRRYDGGHSIAADNHKDEREIARRLRQRERNADRRVERGFYEGKVLSRRGREVSVFA